MNSLTAAERKTLETLANPEDGADIPRVHLEKLTRLNLVEPGLRAMKVTVKGRRILFSRE